MRAAAALLGAVVMIGLAGPVHAEPGPAGASETDTAFLAALQAAGITYNQASQAIVTARMVCNFIASGKPSAEVLDGLKQRNPGLTTEHGAQFVGIAARSYCPDQLVQTGGGETP